MITRGFFQATYSNSGLWIYKIDEKKIIFIPQEYVEYLHHPQVEWYCDEKEKTYYGQDEDEYITDLDEMEWWQQDEFLSHNFDWHYDNDDMQAEMPIEELPVEWKDDFEKINTASQHIFQEQEDDTWKIDHEGYWAA
jgi:hypothetical protein